MISSCLMDTCIRTSTITLGLTAKQTQSSNPGGRNSQFFLFWKRKPPSSVNVSSKDFFQLPSFPTCKQALLFPLIGSLAVHLCYTSTAKAGILSGYTGMESVPTIEIVFNEEKQKKDAENDARFKDSPMLKQLLEKSKLNREKNKQAILDKYCLRGAEWGVGDCSTEGMRANERDAFVEMLKKKTGLE